MAEIGFIELGPWKWCHEHVETIEMHPAHLPAKLRRLRDAWRAQCYQDFCGLDRSDARQVARVPDRIRILRKLHLNSDELAVVSGVFVSQAHPLVMSCQSPS